MRLACGPLNQLVRATARRWARPAAVDHGRDAAAELLAALQILISLPLMYWIVSVLFAQWRLSAFAGASLPAIAAADPTPMAAEGPPTKAEGKRSRRMLAAGRGTFVATSSGSGRSTGGGEAAYAASKFAVEAYVKCLAHALPASALGGAIGVMPHAEAGCRLAACYNPLSLAPLPPASPPLPPRQVLPRLLLQPAQPGRGRRAARAPAGGGRRAGRCRPSRSWSRTARWRGTLRWLKTSGIK